MLKEPNDQSKRSQYYQNPRSGMLKYVPNDITKVLEVGCGEGAFSASLKEQRNNLETWGCEYSEQSANKAKDFLDKIIVGDINENISELPNNYFDCIIFNDVLEHLQDPWDTLLQIKKKLVCNGYLISSIPNVRYYDNIKKLILDKDWKYVPSGVLDKTHLRFFTKKSIARMFKDTGYEISSLEGLEGGINTKFPFKFGLLNFILFNSLNDMRYIQFATVCKKICLKPDED